MKNYTYDYKETTRYCTFSINFNYDKSKEYNQEEIFNKALACMKLILEKNNLGTSDASIINKFLKNAKHNGRIDVMTYFT